MRISMVWYLSCREGPINNEKHPKDRNPDKRLQKAGVSE
jgi:hypothetical protein